MALPVVASPQADAQAPSANAPSAAATSPAAKTPAPPVRTVTIESYDVSGNTLLPQDVVEAAVYPFLGPDKTREDIEGARRALAQAYQQNGYQSVIVQLPPQTVADGIVRIQVTEAPVGKVTVAGADYYSPQSTRDLVPELQEGHVPDLGKVQEQIADANRQPGRRVTPAIKAGAVPGTIDVDLNVTETTPWHASVELNNDHAASTSDLRTVATAHYDNLWGLGHSISATALLAPQNVNDAEVYAGSYLAPLWGTPWSAMAYGYTSNSNVTTLGGLGVLGKGYAIGLRAIRQLPSLFDFSQSLNIGFDFKRFQEGLSLESSNINAAVEYVPFTASYGLQGLFGNSTANLNLSATMNVRGLGSNTAAFQNKRSNASPDFLHFNLDSEYNADLGSDIFADFRLSGQIADGALVSSEQFAAGGLTSVRGYLQAEALGDNGVFGSLELRSPSLAPDLPGFVDEWRFYGFLDAATLTMRNTTDQQNEFYIYSLGAGTRLNLFKHFSLDALIGVPMRSASTTKSYDPVAQFKVRMEN